MRAGGRVDERMCFTGSGEWERRRVEHEKYNNIIIVTESYPIVFHKSPVQYVCTRSAFESNCNNVDKSELETASNRDLSHST